MKRLLDIAAPLVFLALLLGAWEGACRALAVPSYLLPPPSEIATSIAEGWPVLLGSAWNTLSTALLALLIASALASALALVAAMNGLLERALHPLAVALQVTPVVAIAPLVTIWAGLEHPERAVVALAAVVAFFPIFSGTVTGLKAADPELERLFTLYGATPLQKLTRLRLPSAVPHILEAHKVAAGLAVIGAVVAEFVAGSGGAQGLAWRILEAGNRLQTARMFAALVILAVMAALLYGVLQVAERKILAWQRGR